VGKTTKEFFMKKSKILIVGLIVLLMAGGLVFTSCGSCPNNGCSASTTGASSTCGDSGCAIHNWSQGDRTGSIPSCNC
jgi:hypothetical protein